MTHGEFGDDSYVFSAEDEAALNQMLAEADLKEQRRSLPFDLGPASLSRPAGPPPSPTQSSFPFFDEAPAPAPNSPSFFQDELQDTAERPKVTQPRPKPEAIEKEGANLRFICGSLAAVIAVGALCYGGVKWVVDTTPPLKTGADDRSTSRTTTEPSPSVIPTESITSEPTSTITESVPTGGVATLPESSMTVTAGVSGTEPALPPTAPPTETLPTATVAPLPPPPAPTETTVNIGPTKLTIATFNIEHIGDDSYQEWINRLHDAIDALKSVDAAGLQEVRPEQFAALKSLVGDEYDFYPNPANGDPYSPNIVIWKQGELEKIKVNGVAFKYFGGVKQIAPIVMLKSKETGQIVWVGSGHNPADTKLNGMGNEDLRHANDIDYLDKFHDMMKENPYPIFFAIDGNERYAVQGSGDNQNEPQGNNPENLIGCTLAGPDGIFQDALAVANHMTAHDMCADQNAMSNNGGGPVDHVFSVGAEQQSIDVSTSADEAGSDHRPQIVTYLVPMHTELVPIGGSQ